MGSMNRNGSTNVREMRTFTLDDAELRMRGDKLKFVGHAAVFDSESEAFGGGWKEIVSPGAFKQSIHDADDVRFLINHDANYVLARTKSSTMKLTEDETGLLVEADMAPTTYAQDLSILLQRRDVDQMSFGFQVIKDEWDHDAKVRYLKQCRLFDVSAVTFPAYESTDAEVRSLTPFVDLPLYPFEQPWDADAARIRVLRWASADGSGEESQLDWKKLRDAHFYVDPTADHEIDSYRLLFTDVTGGDLKAVPAGVIAAAAELNSGDFDALEAHVAAAQRHVSKYYVKMNHDFRDQDMDFVTPWERSNALEAVRGLSPMEYPALFQELRAGKVLSSGNKKLVKDAIEALRKLLDAAGDEDNAAKQRIARRMRLREKQLI